LLKLADTLDEHVAQLERSFESTDADQQRVRGFTQLFVRPYGFSEAATPRVVRAIEEAANQRR
jgi:regulator of sirC expression with transglutaminase-like and TPR domain